MVASISGDRAHCKWGKGAVTSKFVYSCFVYCHFVYSIFCFKFQHVFGWFTTKVFMSSVTQVTKVKDYHIFSLESFSYSSFSDNTS